MNIIGKIKMKSGDIWNL